MQHSLSFHQQQAGRRQAPYDICTRVFFLRQQLCRYDAGGVTDPIDFYIGVIFIKSRCIFFKVLSLDCGIDRKFRRSKGGMAEAECQSGRKADANTR